MRANVFVLGFILFFLGAIMYISTSSTASAIFSSTFGQGAVLTQVLSRGSQLAGYLAGRTAVMGANIGSSNVSLIVMVVGIVLVIFSEEDLLQGKKKPKKEGVDEESYLKRTSIRIIKAIPSLVIGWLVLTTIYFLGFTKFWYEAMTIIIAFLLTAYMINVASAKGSKSVAFVLFFAFIFIAAVVGSVVSVIFLSFAEQNVNSFWYAAAASLVVVLLAYGFFHTQQYKEKD